MVASQEGDSISVSYFKGNEQGDCLDAVMSSIDVVAHEEVVTFRNFASDFKEFHEIMELSVDISADNDGCSDGDNIGFLSEDLFGFLAEHFDLRFWDGLAAEYEFNLSIDNTMVNEIF